MAVSCRSIREALPDALEWLAGDEEVQVEGPCSSARPRPGAICFCPRPEDLPACLEIAACVVVERSLAAEARLEGEATLYATDQLQVVMAQVNRRFFPVTASRGRFDGHRIHPSAVILGSARLADDVVVGPNAVIWNDVEIGPGSLVGPNSTIEAFVRIGARCHIHANVVIAHHCRIGDDCVVEPQSVVGGDGYGYATDRHGHHTRKPHYGGVVLEDGVELGSGVYLDRGTYEDSVVGAGTKVDNYCHFGHNARVGRHCLITAGLITAGSVSIGDHCVFGGRTTVSGHISICDGVTVAGLSGIRKAVDAPGRYGGYPLMPLGEAMKNEASYVHLARMRRRVAELERRLERLEGQGAGDE